MSIFLHHISLRSQSILCYQYFASFTKEFKKPDV